MIKKTALFAVAIIGSILAGYALGAYIFTVLIPTIGRTTSAEITVTWYGNSSEVTSIDWGIVENNTETSLHDLLNITNIGNINATLSLSGVNQVNITLLILDWNATSPLPPSNSILVQLNQTVNASEETFGYNTKIDATG